MLDAMTQSMSGRKVHISSQAKRTWYDLHQTLPRKSSIERYNWSAPWRECSKDLHMYLIRITLHCDSLKLELSTVGAAPKQNQGKLAAFGGESLIALCL